MNDLILYTTEDGKSQIRLRADLGTVWLTQLEMAELFQTTKQNIAKHLKAIFTEQELSQESVVNQRLTTAADGKNYRDPTRLGNCQGMLDSSGIKTLPEKRPWQDIKQ